MVKGVALLVVKLLAVALLAGNLIGDRVRARLEPGRNGRFRAVVEQVLNEKARAVGTLRRWGKRDSFGLALMAVLDEITAPSDKVVEIRLKKPFPLLPDALAKTGANIAAIMPERLALTDPNKQVLDVDIHTCKCGFAWANMGDPNASIPTPQPTFYRPQFGAAGRARQEQQQQER